MSGSPAARVLDVHVLERTPVLEGREFGPWGPYELLTGEILFGLEPAHPANARIVDLNLAPRNEQGLVEARTTFMVLQPQNPARRSGVALVEVSNRGGKFSMRYFNLADSGALTAEDPAAFGDGLLMRRGLTIIWVGWQHDVPRREGALWLEVPVARHMDGSAITGLMRADWTVDEPALYLPLGHRGHVPYPVNDPADPLNVLTVRSGREAPRRVVPRENWHFARVYEGEIVPDTGHICLAGGFEAGKIYELVYGSRDPRVVGLGLAVIRDVIAYAKHDPGAEFPARYGIAAGVSQTGRFLRHFLYQGFNTDESGRMAYDGLMIITAGAGRGSFNHRFAQPSRDAHRYSAFFYPTDIFPFAGETLYDPLQSRSDGLLAHMHDVRHVPRIFYINTGYEYWGRAASLIHTTVDGTADLLPSDRERIYHLASCQHFTGGFPPDEDDRLAETNAYRGNPLAFKVNYRALLVRLVEWVRGESPPPASAFPKRADGTLVRPADVDFPWLPGVDFPAVIHQAYRVDYGPRWLEGIIDGQPPRLGVVFPSLVAQVDVFGNELGGIRNVELQVPLATYTPWNLRWGQTGGQEELMDFLGTFIPLPRTEAERQDLRDPRPSVAALYPARETYLEQVTATAAGLVQAGFLLPEDRSYVLERARNAWDWVQERTPAADR
ncbi:MAG: hypothetical protein JXQ27_14305 [Acidobacteria bacterium]|nr:hypothetical protein [Acidobacteriota bacterium]